MNKLLALLHKLQYLSIMLQAFCGVKQCPG